MFRNMMRAGAVVLLPILAMGTGAAAATVFATTATVTSADRTATFDNLTSNGISLNHYAEDMMNVTVNDVTYQGFSAFESGDSRTTGFHYGSGGNNSFVTISGSDGAAFTALDFLIGNGNGGTTTLVRWETYRGGVMTGSGSESGVAKGTVVGWSDAAGFDELRVAAVGFGSSLEFGGHQSIAIDDLRAQISGDVPAVPLPASLPLMMGGIALFGVLRNRKPCA